MLKYVKYGYNSYLAYFEEKIGKKREEVWSSPILVCRVQEWLVSWVRRLVYRKDGFRTV